MYRLSSIDFFVFFLVVTVTFGHPQQPLPQATPQQIELQDSNAISIAQLAALNAILSNIPNINGTFGDATPIWGESALVWTVVYEYLRTANDANVHADASNALTAASGGAAGNFMSTMPVSPSIPSPGGPNDNLVLWSMSVISAAEIFGANTPIQSGGHLHIDLAVTAWQQLVLSWDQTSCKGVNNSAGGILSDPHAQVGNATKTALANAGFMSLSAFLYHFTGNMTYRVWAESTYNWMATVGLISSSFEVYASMSSSTCQISTEQWTAAPGVLMTALGTMYETTQLDAYLEQLYALITSTLSLFTTRQGVITEPLCEFGASNACQSAGGSWYKGILVKGLVDAYRKQLRSTSSASINTAISSTLASSFYAMIQTCSGDLSGSWTCSENWNDDNTASTSVIFGLNDQYQTLELLNAIKIVSQVSNGTAFNQYPLPTPSVTQTSTATSISTSTSSSMSSSTTSSIPILGGNDFNSAQSDALLALRLTHIMLILSLLAILA